MKSNTYFKDMSLAALRGNWGKAVITTLVYLLIACAFSSPAIYTSYKTQALLEDYNLTSLSDIVDMAEDPEIMAAQQQSNAASSLSLLVEIFLLLPLGVAFVNAFRKLLVNMDTNILSNLFNFSNYWRKVGGMVLMTILIFLWSLLLVIPGISSVQFAFARLALPWHDASFLSFHGRRPSDEELSYRPGRVLGIITDKAYSSRTIPQLLMELGWPKGAKTAICARLSYGDERIVRTTLGGAISEREETHCVVVVIG